MTEEVVYGPIEPPTSDWRWQEILNLGPFQVMEELKELDVNLFAARSELKEAARELADLEDGLHRAKQEALEGISDPDLKDRLFKGGTKDERKERQEMYLSDLDWVQQSDAEIKVARERKDNAQVAFDSLLDRQVNLGKWANMYSATANLLARIRVVEQEKQTLYFTGPENAPPLVVVCQTDREVQVVRQRARDQGYDEVDEVAYREAMVGYTREEVTEPLSAPPVLNEEDVLVGLEAIFGPSNRRKAAEGKEEEPPFPATDEAAEQYRAEHNLPFSPSPDEELTL